MTNTDKDIEAGWLSAEYKEDGAGFSFGEFVGPVLRHWKILAIFLAVSLTITYFILEAITPLYESTVSILIADPKQQEETGVDRQISPLEADVGEIANQVALIESPVLAMRVAKELGLDKDPEFQRPGLKASLAAKLGLSHFGIFSEDPPPPGMSSDNVAMAKAVSLLQKRLKVDRYRLSYIVTISIKSEAPEKAQRLARTYAQDYFLEQAEGRNEALQRTAASLKARLDELRGRILEASASTQKLKAQSGLGSDTGTGLGQQQAADVNSQYMAARADAAAKSAAYEQLSRIVQAGGDPAQASEVLNSPVVTQLRLQQADLETKEAELRGQFGPQYPDVIAVRSKEETIRKTIAAEVTRILGNLRNASDAATRRESALAESLQKIATGGGSEVGAPGDVRDREAVTDADQKAYDSLLVQYNGIAERQTIPETSLRVVAPASLPIDPSFPPSPILIYAAVGILALIGAAGLALLIEAARAGFQTPTQVEQALGYRVIGMIPLTVSPGTHRSASIVRAMARDPLSRLTEAMRTTRVGLGLAQADQPSKIVLVTSSIPNEGKSTTAYLLAASSAIAGRRTVLIDCDLRQKAISKHTGEMRQGLMEVLAKDAELAAVIWEDTVTGASIIPAGRSTKNPADLLTSRGMQELLAKLREQYDCIIIDSSPLLVSADAVALARQVDKILFVIEWRRVPHRAVTEGLKMLRSEAHRMSGIALTKVNFDELKGFGYGYGYGYNYGSYFRDIDKYYSR